MKRSSGGGGELPALQTVLLQVVELCARLAGWHAKAAASSAAAPPSIQSPPTHSQQQLVHGRSLVLGTPTEDLARPGRQREAAGQQARAGQDVAATI